MMGGLSLSSCTGLAPGHEAGTRRLLQASPGAWTRHSQRLINIRRLSSVMVELETRFAMKVVGTFPLICRGRRPEGTTPGHGTAIGRVALDLCSCD